MRHPQSDNYEKLFKYLWLHTDLYLNDGEKPVHILPLPHGKGYLYLYEDGLFHHTQTRPSRLGYNKSPRHDWWHESDY